MRIVIPNFPCPSCGSKIGDCTTSGNFDAWGLAECTNPECSYVIDAYDLINSKNQKVITR